MIDIRSLENNADGCLDSYKNDLKKRGFPIAGFEELLALNQRKKDALTKAESMKAELNSLSQKIPEFKKSGQDASALMAQLKQLSETTKELEAQAAILQAEVLDKALYFPNKLNSAVPEGVDSSQNQIDKTVGTPTKFSFKAREHWELGEKLDGIDFDRAAKVAGTRFAFLKGPLARMERALIQFFMDLHSEEHGYTEMLPPYIVNSASNVGTGQFPKFVDDVFHLQETDYHLIPTAEVPVTNYFRDEILSEEDLPYRFCAFSPCFRSEAGSHGRDTKGLIRQHQFHKVELMIYSHPSESYDWHEKLTRHAETILERLELPYRRMTLCSRDISFLSAKTFDLEVWLPGANQYREISSCSNFEDFQARRANIRFRSGKNKPQFVHTLNGSGLAVGRTLIAVLENYQREDGSIQIPRALQKYFNDQKVIESGSKKP